MAVYCPEAIKLIQDFESCLRRVAGRPGWFQPYLCPARVATIGWGNTRWPDGRKVSMSDAPISQETADAIFDSELREDAAGLWPLLRPGMHPFMVGAVGSFSYNCGVGAYRGSSLRRKINAGDWAAVPRELAKWRSGGGRVLPGLVRRRTAEAALFMRGVQLLNSEQIPNQPNLPIDPPTDTNLPRPNYGPFWRRAINWILR